MANVESKRCTKCRETKPVALFSNAASSSDGLHWWCKACFAVYNASYAPKAHAKYAADQAANPELCRAQRAEKYLANRVSILAQKKVYQAGNRDAIRARRRAYRIANATVIRAKKKAYHKANADRVRLKTRQWVKANPERARASVGRWLKTHPEQVSALAANRRALVLNAPGDGVTVADRRAVLDLAWGLCAYCNERAVLAVDHIDPLARGGAHDVANLAAACKSCNSSKHDTTLVVWLARRKSAA